MRQSITQAIFIVILLGLNAMAYAENNTNNDCKFDNSPEPGYSVTFTLPAISSDSAQLVLRFYQAWGNGNSLTGWQESLTPPMVTLDNNLLLVDMGSSYADYDDFQVGAVGLGVDEYAQYFTVSIPTTIHPTLLRITGSYQQVAYMDAAFYNYHGTDDSSQFKWQLEKFDYEYTTLNNCNPYLANNPSVFAYSNSSDTSESSSTSEASQLRNERQYISSNPLPQLQSTNKTVNTPNKVDVYRMDRYDSHEDMADDIAADGCSQSYLFADNLNNSEVLILRIKLPTTFISGNDPDTIFGDYQVRYFSISANVNSAVYTKNPLGFWTVNARMLEQYKDSDGYAYVFFVPNDYASELATEQGTISTQPPVITWGKYTGYVLGNPYIIVMRYKIPNPTWQGSPANAICYATPNQLQPLTNNELGDYTPEVYSDTLENFNTGKIGIIDMNNSWPTQ